MNQGKRAKKTSTNEYLRQRSKVRVLKRFGGIIHQSPAPGRFIITQAPEGVESLSSHHNLLMPLDEKCVSSLLFRSFGVLKGDSLIYGHPCFLGILFSIIMNFWEGCLVKRKVSSSDTELGLSATFSPVTWGSRFMSLRLDRYIFKMETALPTSYMFWKDC